MNCLMKEETDSLQTSVGWMLRQLRRQTASPSMEDIAAVDAAGADAVGRMVWLKMAEEADDGRSPFAERGTSEAPGNH